MTMAGKADMQGSTRVPGLSGDISQGSTVCGAHCGCPLLLLIQGPAQTSHPMLRLGRCDAVAAQDFCPYPCCVAGMGLDVL